MELIFYIDPETDQPHIYQHAVSEDEVREVMQRPLEDRPAREGARSVIGRTRAGRLLRILYAPARDGRGWFVITAYDVKGTAMRSFRRRQRRRGR